MHVNRKKFLKFLLAALFAAAVVIAATVYIFAKIYLTPRSIEHALEQTMEQHLKRRVSFERVEADLTGGITLQGVTVYQSIQGETHDLFSCTSAHLTIRYLPLVLRKLIISTVTCRGAALHLRTAGGDATALTGSHRAPPNKPKLDVLMLPKALRLIDGTVIVSDPAHNFETTIADVQLTAEDISIIAPFSIAFSAALKDHPQCSIGCEAEISLLKKKGTGRLTAEQLPLSYANYFFDGNRPVFPRGSTRIEASVTYKHRSHLDIDSTFDFSDVSISFTGSLPEQSPGASFPEGSTPENGPIRIQLDSLHPTITVKTHYEIPTDMLTIERISGTVFSSPLSGDGMIYRKGTDRYLNCSISSNKFAVDNLLGSLTTEPATVLPDLALSGDIELRVNAAGKLGDTIYPTVLCHMSKNALSHPALGNFQPAMQGTISIDREQISLTRFKIGTQHLSATLSGKLSGYRRWPPKTQVKVVSSLIDLPALFSGPDSEIMGDIGPFNLGGITSAGPIDLGNVIFLGLRLSDVQGAYRIENNKAIIQNLTGGIDGGRFNASLTVDLGVKGLEYFLTLDLNNAPLTTVMQLLAPEYRNFVEGTVTGTLALRGNGREPAYFFENLKGDGSLSFADVQIKGLSQLPRITSLADPDRLKNIVFETGGARLRLRSGIIEMDGSLISPDLEITPYGEIGLDTYLDLEAPLKISPDLLTGGQNIAQYLPRDGNWISLPMTIQGTIQEPDVALSEEAIQYIVQKTLPRMLMDILSDKKDSPLRKFLDELSRQQEKK